MDFAKASLADLTELRSGDLEAVLRAQEDHWLEHFAWDLTPTTDLIRSMVNRQRLGGRALVAAGKVVGYTYVFRRGSKAVVGDLFIDGAHRNAALEQRLLESTLNAVSMEPGVSRVECQLLCMDRLPPLRPVLGGTLRTFPRMMMLRNLHGGASRVRPARGEVRYHAWSGTFIEPAVELIALAYGGHVDAQVNDLYASIGGARQFVTETMGQVAGLRFLPPASFVARLPGSAALLGLVMTSLVGADVGHIAQLCVAPSARGRGIGTQLVARSLDALDQAACRAASLTVTRSNLNAVRLYERNRFRRIAKFPAFVWRRG